MYQDIRNATKAAVVDAHKVRIVTDKVNPIYIGRK